MSSFASLSPRPPLVSIALDRGSGTGRPAPARGSPNAPARRSPTTSLPAPAEQHVHPAAPRRPR
ncbi:hypothetical protein [Modestobacter lapidis]